MVSFCGKRWKNFLGVSHFCPDLINACPVKWFWEQLSIDCNALTMTKLVIVVVSSYNQNGLFIDCLGDDYDESGDDKDVDGDDDDDDAKADDGGGVKLQSEWSCPRLANRLQRSSFRPFGIT